MHACFSAGPCHCCLVVLLSCLFTFYVQAQSVYSMRSAPMVSCYFADFWPGMHSPAFLLVRVNAKTQRKDLSFLVAPV